MLYPDWMRSDVERIQAAWGSLAGHALGDLRGFEFISGPRYTYDEAGDSWSTDEPQQS